MNKLTTARSLTVCVRALLFYIYVFAGVRTTRLLNCFSNTLEERKRAIMCIYLALLCMRGGRAAGHGVHKTVVWHFVCREQQQRPRKCPPRRFYLIQMRAQTTHWHENYCHDHWVDSFIRMHSNSQVLYLLKRLYRLSFSNKLWFSLFFKLTKSNCIIF
jgi:hypothetical protein